MLPPALRPLESFAVVLEGFEVIYESRLMKVLHISSGQVTSK